MDNYYKYLKYYNKYFKLKNLLGGEYTLEQKNIIAALLNSFLLRYTFEKVGDKYSIPDNILSDILLYIINSPDFIPDADYFNLIFNILKANYVFNKDIVVSNIELKRLLEEKATEKLIKEEAKKTAAQKAAAQKAADKAAEELIKEETQSAADKKATADKAAAKKAADKKAADKKAADKKAADDKAAAEIAAAKKAAADKAAADKAAAAKKTAADKAAALSAAEEADIKSTEIESNPEYQQQILDDILLKEALEKTIRIELEEKRRKKQEIEEQRLLRINFGKLLAKFKDKELSLVVKKQEDELKSRFPFNLDEFNIEDEQFLDRKYINRPTSITSDEISINLKFIKDRLQYILYMLNKDNIFNLKFKINKEGDLFIFIFTKSGILIGYFSFHNSSAMYKQAYCKESHFNFVTDSTKTCFPIVNNHKESKLEYFYFGLDKSYIQQFVQDTMATLENVANLELDLHKLLTKFLEIINSKFNKKSLLAQIIALQTILYDGATLNRLELELELLKTVDVDSEVFALYHLYKNNLLVTEELMFKKLIYCYIELRLLQKYKIYIDRQIQLIELIDLLTQFILLS